MGKGLDLFHGKAAELIADHLQLFVQPGRTECGVGRLLLHQFHQPQARGLSVARLGQRHHVRGHQRAHLVLAQANVLKADDLGLAHRDAAVNLPEVFAKGDLVDQLFHFAKLAVRIQFFGPFLHLAQAFGVSGQP